MLLGLQVLQKHLGVLEVFLADGTGGHVCFTGKLRTWSRAFSTLLKIFSNISWTLLLRYVVRNWCTLCSSVQRWSAMLLVKCVRQVAHQRFKSFFSLQWTQDILCKGRPLRSNLIWHTGGLWRGLIKTCKYATPFKAAMLFIKKSANNWPIFVCSL